jgi:hypothetical protein
MKDLKDLSGLFFLMKELKNGSNPSKPLLFNGVMMIFPLDILPLNRIFYRLILSGMRHE